MRYANKQGTSRKHSRKSSAVIRAATIVVAVSAVVLDTSIRQSAWAAAGARYESAQETFHKSAQIDRNAQIASSSPSNTPLSGSHDARSVRLHLSLSQRLLSVYQGERLLSTYSVAVGREGWRTPTGEFTVFQKERDPIWQNPLTGEVIPPGPHNPLTSRWIGFWSDGVNAIGFHGTPDESVMGSAVSHGCVRMRQADVVALYEQVAIDTVVVVTP